MLTTNQNVIACTPYFPSFFDLAPTFLCSLLLARVVRLVFKVVCEILTYVLYL